MKLVEEKVNISHDGEGAKCTRGWVGPTHVSFPIAHHGSRNKKELDTLFFVYVPVLIHLHPASFWLVLKFGCFASKIKINKDSFM